ncbi:hypothetical protein [Pseudomonas syringae]|uniref:hypothetical protein n=1 Tax=Pseudomonas syringae TaxID=317 RepID=UPI000CDAB61A|nr:hypothetical protein [Pseudomonas syringae]POR68319.1 hypothetical protein BKM27_19695 [Pseudomonas syringae pv. syringae]POR76196.1 hypothetical protein BKM30_19100 [Pseudomonas syringae pv. syringae]
MITGVWPDQGSDKLKKSEYFAECNRLSGVMAEKNEALAHFIEANPELALLNPTDELLEQFDEHQAALSIAIGNWQSFCDQNRRSIRPD